MNQSLEFQRDIDSTDDLRTMLSEKEFLENEYSLLDKKMNMLKTSMQAFVQEILEDLHNCNSGYSSPFILNSILHVVNIYRFLF